MKITKHQNTSVLPILQSGQGFTWIPEGFEWDPTIKTFGRVKYIDTEQLNIPKGGTLPTYLKYFNYGKR